MNIENIRALQAKLREVKKSETDTFSLIHWYMPSDCGTMACIAGWAYELTLTSDKSKCVSVNYLHSEAVKFLGITSEQAGPLFAPNDVIDYYSVTVDEAIKTLDILIDTGLVDWSHVLEREAQEDYS